MPQPCFVDDGPDENASVIFALRWRAVHPHDFRIPYLPDFAGLAGVPSHERLGAPLLGTGFAPSRQHIIPEFVTADLLDLPLSAHAELVAFTPDGTEVLLYRYFAEQRTWGRLAGRQWRHLVTGLDGIAADQEYFAVPATPTQFIGEYDGREYAAVADPPEGFRLAAKVRVLQHPVRRPARRTPVVTWRGARCAVIRDDDEWLRLRLMRPDAESLTRLGVTCIERGIYEAWAPAREITDPDEIIVRYD